MRKITLLILSISIFSTLSALDHFDNVKFSPDHRNINNKGKVTVKFDLKKTDDIEKIELKCKKTGSTESTIETISSDDIVSTGNELVITGADLLKLTASKKSTSYTLALLNFITGTRSSDDSEDYRPLSDFNSDQDSIQDADLPQDEMPDTDQNQVVEKNDSDSAAEVPDDEQSDTGNSSQNEYNDEKDGKYECELVATLQQEEEQEEENETDTLSPRKITRATTNKEETYTFDLFLDNVPPAKPSAATATPGNRTIKVTAKSPETDALNKTGETLGKYHVKLKGLFLDKEGNEVEKELSYVFSRSSSTSDFTIEGKDGFSIINNDAREEKYNYRITLSAEDKAGNHNPSNSITITGYAATTEGFWTHYKAGEGKDDGGYCFIATASYGSYFHPFVKILRSFRDRILLPTKPGKAFVRAYYNAGPTLVGILNDYPVLKSVVRIMLLPLVALAWLILNPAALACLLLSISGIVLFRMKKTGVLFILALLILPLTKAEAIEGEIYFKGGFYYPSKIDDSAEGNPFEDIAGKNERFVPSLGFGLDIPIWRRIKVTARGSAGFVRFSGKALFLDGKESKDTTYFHIVPVSAELKIRPVYSFPLRPYVTFGGDYNFWWIRENGKTQEDGATHGFHTSFGLQLSLNWLEPRSALQLEKSSGISDSSIYAHYRIEKVDDFGDSNSFDLSCNRFEFGLVLDF